jgi:AcrR family transcriptional regulator
MTQVKQKKYDQIINSAKELFWKYGIRRVTIEDICKKADVSRMTFYKYFSNKNILAKTLLNIITDSSMEKYDSIIKSELKYPEKVRQMILLKIEGTNDISKEFLNDLNDENNADLFEFLQSKIMENLSRIQTDFVTASEQGEIRKGIKPEFLLYFLNRILEMSKDPELLKMYDSAQDMIMEMTNIFFYGILSSQKR